MYALQWLLAVVSGVGGIALAVMAKTHAYRPSEVWLTLGVAAFLAANFIFVISADVRKRGDAPSRLKRMVGLWFDAKERELHRRAGKEPPTS
jgi:hypothetical protein